MLDRKLLAAGWILIALLQGCAGKPQNHQTTADSRNPEIIAGTANDRPNTVMTTPAAAREENLPELLSPVPSGYRDLGGAVFKNGTLMVITASNSPEGPNDLGLSMVHGVGVRAS